MSSPPTKSDKRKRSKNKYNKANTKSKSGTAKAQKTAATARVLLLTTTKDGILQAPREELESYLQTNAAAANQFKLQSAEFLSNIDPETNPKIKIVNNTTLGLGVLGSLSGSSFIRVFSFFPFRTKIKVLTTISKDGFDEIRVSEACCENKELIHFFFIIFRSTLQSTCTYTCTPHFFFFFFFRTCPIYGDRSLFL